MFVAGDKNRLEIAVRMQNGSFLELSAHINN